MVRAATRSSIYAVNKFSGAEFPVVYSCGDDWHIRLPFKYDIVYHLLRELSEHSKDRGQV
jgi:hypothetical protein